MLVTVRELTVTHMDPSALPVRAVIADPVGAARSTLHRLLEAELGWEVVGEAADGLGAIRTARSERADVLLVDDSVEDVDLETIHGLLPPTSGILVVGLHSAPGSLASARGAAVLKGVPASRLRTVVEDALREAWASRHQIDLRDPEQVR